ncbi:VOC family protein [Actinomadura flavalba]|uniref:VOC family protein n=1 Tax=Actinomadura flavalba TaxID=1120938 RepID=UPI0003619A4E|nr:VOC family protein [Actinomadura flavalba]
MLRGFATINYWADDLEAAVAWYTEVLGIEPYFRVDGYVEFRVGDYRHELGLVDGRYRYADSDGRPAGPVQFWHVDDVRASYRRLLDLGATPVQEPIERGEGFVPAAVRDPFGNVLGIMENAHYLEVLAER